MARRSRADEWQLLAWVLFLAAFVAIGAVPFDTLHRKLRVQDQGPTNSTDAMFLTHLGAENGSARIADCLRRIPTGSRVAVVFRFGSYRALSSQLICHAAWTFGLRPIQVSSTEADSPQRLREAGATAGFYLEPDPPRWFSADERISSSLCFGHLAPE